MTLSGSVLPVGGIREKVLAAQAAGVKTVILPKRNFRDVSEIPPHIIKGLEFVYAEKYEDVYARADLVFVGGHESRGSRHRLADRRRLDAGTLDGGPDLGGTVPLAERGAQRESDHLVETPGVLEGGGPTGPHEDTGSSLQSGVRVWARENYPLTGSIAEF